MCGISGIYQFGNGAVDATNLRASIDTLRHRGPDDTGIYVDGRVGFAHARLSIVDLAGGHQPMETEDGSLCIIFNGEIFNYIELRAELESKGHRFRTRSDTEVILEAYREYGDACLDRFNGQWAFALWDKKAQRLLLSRDHYGIHPLYYSSANGRLVFASEVKALFAHPDVKRELDPVGLDQIFTFWVPLPPRTVFRGLQEIPPGYSLIVDPGGIRLYQYWRPQYEVDFSLNGHSSEELLELLTDAVRKRLRADVPVGAYLSGGLDSTLNAALIRKVSTSPLKTFSVSFDDAEFDESSYQRQAVQFLGTEHEEIRCTTADIGRVFPEVIHHAERPVLRTSPAPLYLLSKLVRDQGFKVVLTGEGADDLLAGYDIFKEAKVRLFCARHPESKLRPLLFRRLYNYLPGMQAQPDAYRQAFFRTGVGEETNPLFSHMPRWQLTSRLKLFFSDDLRAQLKGHDSLAEMEAELPTDFSYWDWLNKAQYLESMYLLPGYILSSQGERMMMANSVEGRYPFLDPRVAQFAAKLPAAIKIKVLEEKHLLKDCSRDLVPQSIRERTKQPYRAPEAATLMNSECARELLSPKRIREFGLFHPEAVSRLLSKVDNGRAVGIGDNMALAGILSTQILVDRFIHP
jgi:asparagine synthase (glutamine-hydrolysing)